MAEVALITGCATGIGRALAENLNKRKTKDGKPAFKVYATDYRLDGVKDLEEQGMGVAQLDVTDIASINAAIELIITAEGRIDLLVCNAGMAAPGWLAEMDYNNVERIFNVNLHGVFRVAQPVARHMMARRSGKIAVMSSVNASIASPFNGPYCGTKAAVSIMAEGLRTEVAPFGVKVVTIVPGWVRSDILANSTDDWERYETPESFYQLTIDRVREMRNNSKAAGFSTLDAANDIARGLAKLRPPTCLYTGTLLFYSLFWGFVQMWFRPHFLAESQMKRYGLDEAAEHGPRGHLGPAGAPNGVHKQE